MSDEAPPPIIGVSAAIKRAVLLLERYARTPLPVLIVGATGTGKEVFAQHVHHLSGRRPMVDIDCGAIPHDLIEGLLFGARRGVYTGATDDRAGLIEQSDRGTLFLDEVLSLPEESQRKLLRVLDTREIRRLGDTEKRAVDLRLVAAGQEDAYEQVSRGTFRRDLYERLSGVVITLPPLARRSADILPLARYFAALQQQRLTPAAERVLEDYGWPGNVRELRKVIARAGPVVPDGTLPASAMKEAIILGATQQAVVAGPLAAVALLRSMTRSELRAKCEEHGWRARETAAALGVGRTTLFKELRAKGLSLNKRPEFASSRRA